jgi:hypothetical protein
VGFIIEELIAERLQMEQPETRSAALFGPAGAFEQKYTVSI